MMVGRQILVGLALTFSYSAALLGQEKTAVFTDAEPEYFLMHASSSGLAEVAMSRLAKSQSEDPAVQKFANQLIEDHSVPNRELELLAKKYLLPIAKEPAKTWQTAIDKLSKLKAADFDRLYMSTMLKSHNASKELYHTQSVRGKNGHLKDFATRTLPTIELHLKMARELASRVGAE